MDKFGGRKFLVLLIMLIVGGVAETYSRGGLSTNFVYLMLGLYGAFTAGNVGITLRALKNPQTNLQDTVENGQDVAETPETDFLAADDAQSQPPLHDGLVECQAQLQRLEAGLTQVVASITPQNQALEFLTRAEQRRQMTEIAG